MLGWLDVACLLWLTVTVRRMSRDNLIFTFFMPLNQFASIASLDHLMGGGWSPTEMRWCDDGWSERRNDNIHKMCQILKNVWSIIQINWINFNFNHYHYHQHHHRHRVISTASGEIVCLSHFKWMEALQCKTIWKKFKVFTLVD